MNRDQYEFVFSQLSASAEQGKVTLGVTSKEIRDRGLEAGIRLARSDIGFLIKGLLLSGHRFDNDELPQEATYLGATFAANALFLADKAQLELSDGEVDEVIEDTEWDRVRLELERATTEVRRDRVLASLARSGMGARDLAAPPLPEAEDETTAAIGRILGRLDGATSEERQAAEALAKKVSEASHRHWHALMTELRHRIQLTIDAVAVRTRQRSKAAERKGRLRGLEGPQVDEVDRKLADVVAGDAELHEELVVQAEQIERDGRRASDAVYAAAVMSEALESMGYELDEGFSTLLVGKGRADFHRPGWGDYWIRLRVDLDRSPFLSFSGRVAGVASVSWSPFPMV